MLWRGVHPSTSNIAGSYGPLNAPLGAGRIEPTVIAPPGIYAPRAQMFTPLGAHRVEAEDPAV